MINLLKWLDSRFESVGEIISKLEHRSVETTQS